MADFPTGIYDPRDIENVPGVTYDATKKTRFYAEDHNALNNEVVAIETALGINPQGIYVTVKAWLTQLASDVGLIPIARGGTGQTTAAAGFNALSPMTTLGDMIYGGVAGTRTRLGGSTSSQKRFLTQNGDGVNSAAPVWSTVDVGNINLLGANVATFLATPSSANFAAVITDETGTAGFVVFSDSPTFQNFIIVPLVKGGTASAGDLTLQSTSHATKGKIKFGASAFVETSDELGIGTADPDTDSSVSLTSQKPKIIAFESVDKQLFIRCVNKNTGSTAAAVVGTIGDVASQNFQSHSSARTVARFGVTLASWNEFLAVAGEGLAIGTNASKPLILGTAGLRALYIDASQNVSIGSGTPNANAQLDVQSTTKAFMPPRMTTTQRDAIASPTEGMYIHNTTTHVLNFYNGTAWAAV